MSWILLTAGYLGGVYMQTWDIGANCARPEGPASQSRQAGAAAITGGPGAGRGVDASGWAMIWRLGLRS
jgi:hypothetical protein